MSYFCIWCKVRIQFYSSACRYPVSPKLCSRDCPFPRVVLAPLLMIRWTYTWQFISGPSIPVVYLSVFISVTLFLLLWFCNIFWNQQLWFFQCCSYFPKLFLALWGSLKFHMNLKNFSISANNALDVLIEITLTLQITPGNTDILAILSLLVH